MAALGWRNATRSAQRGKVLTPKATVDRGEVCLPSIWGGRAVFLAIAKNFGIDDEIGSLLQYFPLPKRQFLILGRGIGSLL